MGGKRKKEKSRLAEYGKNSFLLFILMMTASVVIGYGIGFIIGNEVDISIESSSLPGKGYGHNICRRNTIMLNQIGYPSGQDPGLPTSSPGQNQ